MNLKIPVLICVDVEPNEWYPKTGGESDWTGYKNAFEYFQTLRPAFYHRTGSPVHFNWFYRMDPQIEKAYGCCSWGVNHYRKFIEISEREGDGIGLHAHAYRWDPARSTWMVDHGNQEWVNHCLTKSFESYKVFFKRGCEIFRFGSRWMNNSTMEFLEKMGNRFELTVEPDYVEERSDRYTEYFTGTVPNHKGVSKMPYRPSKSDFRKSDLRKMQGMWVIPISTGTVSHPYTLEQKIRFAFSRPQALKKFFLRLDTALDPYFFRLVLDNLLRKLPRPYLTLIQRTDIFMKPYFFENAKKNFEILLSHPLAARFIFATPSEAMSILGYPV